MGRQPDQDRNKLSIPRRLLARFLYVLGAKDSGSGSPVKLGAWLAATLVLMLAAAGVAAGSATLSRRLCSSCHEMEPKVAAWRVSPHAQVGCYSCHGSPYSWYRFPQSLVDRAAMMGRFMRVHWTGQHPSVIGERAGTGAAIRDAVCLQCHDPARTGTSRLGVLIQHEKHAKRNKSCVSCHLWTAHQDPTADRNLLMMNLCFNCHGQASHPKASPKCAVCHPKELPLRPVSHRGGTWKSRHGKMALADRKQCAMCHEQRFCTNCHGLEMPHPLGWARGKSSHSVAAQRNRAVCEQCHTGKTYLCTMCHHRDYDVSKGPWVNQHFKMVEKTGAAFCMKCHEGAFCVDCHTSRSRTGTSGAL